MQSTGPGMQSFQLVRRAHQADLYEIWDGQSSSGQPAAMVLLPPTVANNPAHRAAFGATVAWAQRPENNSVIVVSHDAAGPTPWVAILPDPQGRAVWSFLQQLQAALPQPNIPAQRPAPGYDAARPAMMPPVSVPPVSPPVSPPPVSSPPSAFDEQGPTKRLGPPTPSYGSVPPVSPPPSAFDEQAPTTKFASPPADGAQPTSSPQPPSPTVWPVRQPSTEQTFPPFAPPVIPSAEPNPPEAATSGPPTSWPQGTVAPVNAASAPWQTSSPPPPVSGGTPWQTSSPPAPVSGGTPWQSSSSTAPVSGASPSSAPPWQTSSPPVSGGTPSSFESEYPASGGSPFGTGAPPSGPSQPTAPPWETPGYPQPVRSPDVPPLPGPGQWPSQQRRSRKPLLFVLVGVIVLLLVAGGVAAVLFLPGRDKPGDKPVGQTAATASPSPSPSPTPPPSFQASAPPVALVGTTWQPTDKTTVQAFDNWPFAFRTAADMTCEFWVGEPDYKANNCKRGTEPNHTVMAFVIHRCVNGCDATEQAQFETMTPWKPDVALTAKDPTTKVGDVDYGNGRDQLTMVHYFGSTPGGPLEWVVIVQGNSPTADRELVRKTANDIRSQTA